MNNHKIKKSEYVAERASARLAFDHSTNDRLAYMLRMLAESVRSMTPAEREALLLAAADRLAVDSITKAVV